MRDLVDTAPLEQLAPAGYYIALRVGFAFPLVEINELPHAWVDKYTQDRLMLFDPVIQWVYSQSGAIRWSEIDRPDPRMILQQASVFGLKFGVAVSHFEEGRDAQRSFGSFSRADREYTEDEIKDLTGYIARLHREMEPPSNLTAAEVEALQMVRSGMRTKQIAHELGVSEGAVKQRLKNAKLKLGAATGTEAAAKAQGFGLL